MATKLVNVKGLDKLYEELQKIPAKIERNIMRAAMRKGANVFMRKARANVGTNGSVETGILRKGIKSSTRTNGGVVTASVKATGKHSYLAPWIEFGVQPHSTKKNAKAKGGKNPSDNPHPGFSPKPFMRPAFDTEASAAIAAVGAAIRERLLTKHGIDTPMIEVEEQ